jgi:hypothetical protein
MKSMFTRAALLLLMAVAAIPARAQFDRFPGVLKQYQLGYGLSFASADYIITAHGVTPGGIDTTTKLSTGVKSKGGFCGSTGTAIKLKRLGRISTLSLGLDLMYNAYLWDFNAPSRTSFTDSGFKFYYDDALPFDGASLNAGLAISADFKFGVEAMMDKAFRWGWTGGVGVIPSVSTTALTGVDANYAFGVQPIVKTEVAVRAGIVMKLRLQYAFGNLTYLDVTSKERINDLETTRQTQLLGKSNFTASFIVMPFSFMYKKSEWYNSY